MRADSEPAPGDVYPALALACAPREPWARRLQRLHTARLVNDDPKSVVRPVNLMRYAPSVARKKSLSTGSAPALFIWASREISLVSLRIIAGADYERDLDAHFAALKRLVQGDLSLIRPLRWEPREVLELTRYDQIPSDSGDSERHLRRLFASVVLLMAAVEPTNAGFTNSDTLALFDAIESVLGRFPSQQHDLLALLATVASGEVWDRDELGYLHLGRFLVLEVGNASSEALVAALDLADEAAVASRATWNEYALPPAGRYGWITDITTYDQRRSCWSELLDAAQRRLRQDPHRLAAAERLEALATRTSTKPSS